MSGEIVGVLAVLALAVFLTGIILQSRLRPQVKSLLVIGLVLRVVGSQVYYYLSEWIYGYGDYSTYHQVGVAWADGLLSGSLDSVRSPYLVHWCCTGFTIRLSGLLFALLGPNVNGAFLVFGLVGYVGIVAIAVAFARAYPDVPLERYLVWIVYFPSLWYWPAALGKDALMLGGIGLAVLGYIGRRGRTGWLPLALGMALVFMVRPQVAAVLILAMMLAYWVGSEETWTISRVLRGVVLLGGGVLVLVLAGGAMGLELTDPREVEQYLDAQSSANAYGGSAVQGGMLLGIVNVLLRPFLWEARGVASLIAALEVTALWGLAIWKWADIKAFFLAHRRSRLLWFSLIFVAVYVLLTGIALGNLGLIARQRVHIFPFIFMLFAGGPVLAGVRRSPSRSSGLTIATQHRDGIPGAAYNAPS